MDIKVLISAPGDQHKQVEATKRSLDALNKILGPHGHSLKIAHWKSNVSTGQGERAQDVINSQIQDCDVMVAILGDRLGTPTGEFASGTVEEIELFLSRRRDKQVRFDVHVFFNRTQVDPYAIDVEQLRNVQMFRRSLNAKGVNFGEFSSVDELSEMVQLGVSTYLARNPQLAEAETTTPKYFEDFDELGFDDAIELATEDMANVAETMHQLNSDMETWNKKIAALAEEAPTAVVSSSSKDFFERVAEALRDAQKKITPQIASITESLASGHARLNYGLTVIFEDIGTQNPTEWTNVIETLEASLGPFVDAFKKALEAIKGARDAIDSLPRRRSF